MNKTVDPLRVVSDLQPCLLEQLAEDGYARHRDDLALLTAERHLPVAREQQKLPADGGWPRRYLLTGGIAVTATAAMAAALVAVGSPQGVRHRPPGLAAAPGRAASARSFLLASAKIAAHAPATTGTYWYVKERDAEPTSAVTRPGVAPPVHKLLHKLLLPGITYDATEESWTGQDHGRTVVDENLAFHFASAADKARWEAAGKPPLATAAGTSTKPKTSNYHMTYFWGYGARRLTMKGVEALPRTAAGLNKALHRMWASTPDNSAATGLPDPTYGAYLFQWAGQLLTGPASPGTRAALYRLLAQQPGIRLVDSVTDPLGRAGVGVTDGGGDFLVIDPRTAMELASSSALVQARATMAMTRGVSVMEAMGWTNQLGAVPQP